jgi:hypothetical protein
MLSSVHLYNIFPHYLINRTIFEKKTILYMKCVFSLQFLSQTYLILRRIELYRIKKVYRSPYIASVIITL